MVESRWLRWIGPGVVALGAVGLVGSHDTRCRAAAVGSGVSAAGRRAERSAAARDASPTTGVGGRPTEHRGSGSIRSSTAAGRCAASGSRSVSTATGAPGSSTCPPSRSPPGRSARIVLVGSDDGVRVPPRGAGRRRRLLLADRDRARRHPAGHDRPGRDVDLSRCASIASRRADLGIWLRPIDGRRAGPPRPRRRSRPTVGSAGRGRPSSPGTWRATDWPIQSCGEVACRTRILDPDGGPTATMLDAPDLGTPRRRRRRPGRDLRAPAGASPARSSSTDLAHRSAGGRSSRRQDAAVLVDDPGRDAPRPRDRRSATGRAPRTRRRSMAGRAADLGPLPDGLRPPSAAPAQVDAATGCRRAGSCSPRTAGCRPMGRSADADLRHVPDGVTVPLD